jgi:Family of unknown function (DUF5683)
VEVDTVETVDDDVPTVEGPKAKIFEGPPGRSALYSLIAPGAGQIFNGSYWKAPIVWGVVGTMGTVMALNINTYNEFDSRYIAALKAEINMMDNPDPDGLSSSQLFNLRTQANKNRQLTIVMFSLVWIGQSVEAFVDAHLKEFDVSDDLSIRFKPIMMREGASIAQTGIAIRF